MRQIDFLEDMVLHSKEEYINEFLNDGKNFLKKKAMHDEKYEGPTHDYYFENGKYYKQRKDDPNGVARKKMNLIDHYKMNKTARQFKKLYRAQKKLEYENEKSELRKMDL